MIIFDAATKRPSETPHGREGFFFAENGEHTWYSISKEISRVLVQMGIGYSDEPTTFTKGELIKYWGSEVWFLDEHSTLRGMICLAGLTRASYSAGGWEQLRQ